MLISLFLGPQPIEIFGG